MAHQRPLSDFPSLHGWFEKAREIPNKDRTIPYVLALKTCAVLSSDPSRITLKSWIATVTEGFTTSSDLRQDILSIVSHFHEHDADFAELLGDLTHLAVTLELGELLLPVLRVGAEKSKIAALRFLAAWTALNCNQPDICIDECEKVDEPFAPLHSLQGQAYLETGKAKEALEALDVATTLAPHDAVAWFQKAKALHVMDRSPEAFESLRACEHLAPQNDEIALMMGMVALDSEVKSAVKEYAWKKLRTHLSSLDHIPQVPLTLIRLSLKLGDKHKALDVISTWQTQGNLRSPDEFRDLTEILRDLQSIGWMDVAQKLLEKLTLQQTS